MQYIAVGSDKVPTAASASPTAPMTYPTALQLQADLTALQADPTAPQPTLMFQGLILQLPTTCQFQSSQSHPTVF